MGDSAVSVHLSDNPFGSPECQSAGETTKKIKYLDLSRLFIATYHQIHVVPEIKFHCQSWQDVPML